MSRTSGQLDVAARRRVRGTARIAHDRLDEQQEERMHANLSQYRIATDNIDQAMHLADTQLADRLAEESGFVAYELMATEDGNVCSMTIFQDREGAERSQEIAAEFVREHLSGMDVERLGGMTGEIMVSRARDQVLEAAHH
jgi:GTPase